jgi:hypothetical protein
MLWKCDKFQIFGNDSKIYKRCNMRVSIALDYVRVTSLPWKGSIYYVRIQSLCLQNLLPSTQSADALLSLLACLAMPCFFHITSQMALFFGKSYRTKLCGLILCIQIFFCNIFHPKKNWARYCQKCIHVSMYSTPNSCQTSKELDYLTSFWEIFKYQISWKSV